MARTESQRVIAGRLWLSPADKLHNLQTRPTRNRRTLPIPRLHNAAIKFHRHARRIELERLQQLANRLPVADGPNLSVNGDLNLFVG